MSTVKTPEEILQRLEQLKKWQEEQKQMLIERQKSQRQLLEEEQRLMYEKHGLTSPNNTAQFIMEGNREKSGDIKADSNADKKQVSGASRNSGGNNCNKEGIQSEKPIVKRPFLRRGEGLTSRFKVNPEKFRLNNLPRYKYAIQAKRPPNKLPKKFTSAAPFTTKSSSNSTVGDKADSTDSGRGKSVTSLPGSTEKSTEVVQIPDQKSPQRQNVSLTTTDASGTPSALSWAEILNPNKIKPFSLDNLQKFMDSRSTENSWRQDSSTDELSLFELLEKKAQEGSILVDTSILQRWIRNIQSPGQDMTDCESSVDISSLLARRISPVPSDINQKVQIDDSDESSSGTTDGDDDNDESYVKSAKARVRFSEQVEVNEIHSESDTETVSSIEESFLNSTQMSTPNSKPSAISESRQTLEDSSIVELSTTLTEDTTLSTQQTELLEKTEVLKSRLVEMEKQIAEFQKHNAELIRLKQECEMEKLRFEQDRQELTEKLKDERIKLEIQIHDERMQIEEERKKYGKLMKEHRTKSRRENEEIVKLREQVERLTKENRDKETKHSAAQARMRTQIRNLEKDLKEFSVDVDVLRKEKKRLEGENARLVRNGNNKMLQEINKSIAKLVPKATVDTVEAESKNAKPIKPKVTSHISDTSRRKSFKSLSQQNRSTPPQLHQSQETPDSSDENSSDLDDNQSAYFKKRINKPPPVAEESHNRRSPVDNENEVSAIDPADPKTDDEFKREIINADGSKDIWYTNGNIKKISADGMIIRMLYYNKDIKETNIHEGTVKYYYSEKNTWHTTYLDGLEILEYPNGQTEHRFKDGTVEMHYENGSIRITSPADPTKLEEWRYPDGTKLVKLKTGDKIILFPNGQKEVHTKMHKRREFPDGTVKMLYPDGSQETRYSNGRVRIKDKDGNLIMDTLQTT